MPHKLLGIGAGFRSTDPPGIEPTLSIEGVTLAHLHLA
jgi:hypothetical protein